MAQTAEEKAAAKAAKDAEKAAAKAAADSADAPAGKGTATVSWKGQTRVYSKEEHGAAYKDLAKEFAGKVGGEVL